MDSTDQSAQASAKTDEVAYRCKICGIESRETTCFVGTPNRTSPLRTCITCGRVTPGISHLRKLFALVAVLFLPVFFLAGFIDKSKAVFPQLLLAACLIQPITLILHELGHGLTARLLGLQVSLMSFGVGPKVWAGKMAGTLLCVHGWPITGLTYVGSRSLRFLRLRVWLTILMGPGSNLLLIAAAVIAWAQLAVIFGANVVLLWMIFNGLYFISNLLPFQSRRTGVLQRTDGYQLLQIPFNKSTDLAIYLSATALIGATQLFEDREYEAARYACLEGLEQLPQDPMLTVVLSACQINLGDYESAQGILKPLYESSATLAPALRATIENNLSIAMWLRNFNAEGRGELLLQADALSDHAYHQYPCVLPYRSTRALLLAATNRPEHALELLQYLNYARGTKDDRASREIARAFALRQLNRNEESDQALAAGLKLSKERLPWLRTIGLIA